MSMPTALSHAWRRATTVAVVIGITLSVLPAAGAVAATIDVPADQPTIQAALDAAEPGDVIIVADGTYTGPGNKGLLFPGIDLTLRSAGGPTQCIIDCEDDDRAIRMLEQDAAFIRIEGFTFTRGLVDTSYPSGRKGGAAVINASSPLFVDCIFDDNRGHTGGAIFCSNGASPIFINCRITRHQFLPDGGVDDIHVGGGLFCRSGSTPTLINCTIADNLCAPGLDHTGGGVQARDPGTVLTLVNCVVWGNDAFFGDQIGSRDESVVVVRHSIVQGGEAEVFLEGGFIDWWPSNLDVDPSFADPENGDYTLHAGSPAIDAGDTPALPADVTTDLGGGPRVLDDPETIDTGIPGDDLITVDMGSDEFDGGGVLPCPTDLDGDGATGFGDLVAVLSAWGPCGGCPADFDGDGDIGFDDLVVLLASWGPCPG